MKTTRLPLSMLVALGLAPGCKELDCRPQPCLKVDDPALRKPEPEVTPCLSKPRKDPVDGPPAAQPCLSDSPDDEIPPPDAKTDDANKSGEGMARREVIERLRTLDVLPADVTARLEKG